MSVSEQSIIERSSKVFFSGTLLSRISGLARDVITAYVFGSSAAIAALLVAFRFSSLLRRLFGEGALHAAFVPIYEQKRAQSEQDAAQFFIQISFVLSISLLFIVILLQGAFSYIYFSKAMSESFSQILFLSLILLPSLFFICLGAFFSSLLQCHNSYFIPSISSALFNIVWILGVLRFSGEKAETAVSSLAVWMVLGTIIQWFFCFYPSLKFLKPNFSIKLFKFSKSLKKSLQTIFKPLSLGLLGVSTAQINSALDSLFARSISLEGPAYLWYAIRIEQVPLALFGIAMAGAVLPPLSRAFQRNTEDYHKLLDYSLTRALGLLVPCTAALFLTAPCCINLIYHRGLFNNMSALQTSYCLWAYNFGLIAQGLVLILAPAFYVQNKYEQTTKASLIACLLNVFLNAFFAFYLKLPTWSIALATALTSWFQLGYLLYFLVKIIKLKELHAFLGSAPKVLALCFTSVCCAYLVFGLIFKGAFVWDVLLFPTGFKRQCINFGALSALFVIFLFSLAKLFGVQDLVSLFEFFPFYKKSRRS